MKYKYTQIHSQPARRARHGRAHVEAVRPAAVERVRQPVRRSGRSTAIARCRRCTTRSSKRCSTAACCPTTCSSSCSAMPADGNEEQRARAARRADPADHRADEGVGLHHDAAGPRAREGAPRAGGGGGEGEPGEVKFEVTDKALDFLGYRALRDLLGSVGHSSAGRHDTRDLSTGIEASGAPKPYEFGDTHEPRRQRARSSTR